MCKLYSAISHSIYASFVVFVCCSAPLILAPALISTAGEATKEQPKFPVSYCQAVAERSNRHFKYASFTNAGAGTQSVEISFVGHSTFRIVSPEGVVILTDYAGITGKGRLPDIATMNRAHETHYTDFPDPRIEHVLPGWNDKQDFAFHDVTLKDVRVRNVPTNIRDWREGTLLYGNSIFVFEIASLCIGHVGHLQHTLTEKHLAQIGQLDVVFVPADGVYTMDHAGMVDVIKQLDAKLTIPMHYFSPSTLKPFLDRLRLSHIIEIRNTATISVSRKTLPHQPKVVVLPGY